MKKLWSKRGKVLVAVANVIADAVVTTVMFLGTYVLMMVVIGC